MKKFNRVLIKISGGALTAEDKGIFDKSRLDKIADNIIMAQKQSIEVSILIGGGNIFRGRTSKEWDIERAEADNIGMLATIVNSLILKAVLNSKTSSDVRVMTSIPMNSIAEPYIRLKAIKYLEKKSIVILGGGTGQPFVTTDYPSVQRALELRCDAVFMAKEGIDGVYTEDPIKSSNAKRYKTLNCNDAINLGLKVADQSAFVLAKDYNIPLYIFDFNEENSIVDICNGKSIGTNVGVDCKSTLY